MMAAENVPTEQLLVLLEEVAQSSRQISVQNRALRQELEDRDRAHSEAYQNLEKRLEDMANRDVPPRAGIGRSNRRRRAQAARVVVPVQCRRITKTIYGNLTRRDDFNGFYLDESFTSNNNLAICERVIGEVHHKYSGEQNCPWKRIVLEAVLQRYFLSLCEKGKLMASEKYGQHKKVCRKNGRQREKISRRTLMLERMAKWDVRKKGKVAEILVPDAMSSEESCFESDGEGREKLVKYKVKRLSWESSKLKGYKKELDRKYRKCLSKRAKDRILPREDSDQPSNRKHPEDFPKWAVTLST